MKNIQDECCPEFHPEKWDEKTFIWSKKKFIKESIPTFLHIPFPPMIWSKIWKMSKLTEKSKKMEPNREDTLVLFNDPSPFKSEIYLSVTWKVSKAKNVNLSWKFMSKVFDGAYNDVPKFIKQMNDFLTKKGKILKNYYIHYAYCPKCSKKFKHNYMILFAQI